MDISKLPRLSKTDEPPPAVPEQSGEGAEDRAAQAPPVQPLPYDPPGNGTGVEGFLSIAIGLFLLFMYPRFLQWASSRIFHTHFNEFQDQQTLAIVPYQTLPEFWMDLGPTLFGIVLVLDGLVLSFARRRGLLLVTFAATVLVTAYNLIYVVISFGKYGFAPISFLAAAFGIYIGWHQWTMVRQPRPARA